MLQQLEHNILLCLRTDFLRGMGAPVQEITVYSVIRRHGEMFVYEQPEQLARPKLSQLLMPPVRLFILPGCQTQGSIRQLLQVCLEGRFIRGIVARGIFG